MSSNGQFQWMECIIYNKLFNEESSVGAIGVGDDVAVVQCGRIGACLPSLLLLRCSALRTMRAELYMYE